MADLFDEKSKDWDMNNIVRELSSAIGSSIIKHLPLHSEMDVMDFGAGTGLISSHIVPHVKKITAVDISESMLAELVSKSELKGKVEALCQDIILTPIQKQFDLIMSAMALHHVEHTDKLIQRFSEHLKSGAMIALADLDREDGSFHPIDTKGVFHLGFERNSFKMILEKHGFQEISFITAHTVIKQEIEYPIFLVIATKS